MSSILKYSHALRLILNLPNKEKGWMRKRNKGQVNFIKTFNESWEEVLDEWIPLSNFLVGGNTSQQYPMDRDIPPIFFSGWVVVAFKVMISWFSPLAQELCNRLPFFSTLRDSRWWGHRVIAHSPTTRRDQMFGFILLLIMLLNHHAFRCTICVCLLKSRK